ncbi:uncharacterized protein TA13295 [Theileria annulata]|uniref:Hsp70 nucleotide exchange factor fes1 n=1 Tax=Theileria annulata TaxID=5874 RepID=Q4UEG3_THEAN|nr:uncharacterized protein TA13295 [Theileria annulata]CAI74526.1 hypothetical protein, conserved [Theileria annulata]|eukprot:XP_952258.1 hypothetical protein, conserved [Theileria annulata]
MSLPNWKGLLKWSLSKVDPKRKDEVKQMSKEDLEFLEGALSSVNEHEKQVANSVSEVNRISKAFMTSENGENKNKEIEFDKKVLLESMQKLEEYFEEHPSNATSLARQGLLESFTLLLKSDDMEVLSSTLSIISCSFSNNESVLEEASKTQLVPNLLKLKNKLKDTQLEPRLITAISSSIRNCRRAEQLFVTLGGLSYLKDSLESTNLKTRERAILLFNHFISLDKASRLIMATLNPYKILNLLLPLDPENNGIQFTELSCTLVFLILQKHSNAFTGEELNEVSKVLDRELQSLGSLNAVDYEKAKQIEHLLICYPKGGIIFLPFDTVLEI